VYTTETVRFWTLVKVKVQYFSLKVFFEDFLFCSTAK